MEPRLCLLLLAIFGPKPWVFPLSVCWTFIKSISSSGIKSNRQIPPFTLSGTNDLVSLESFLPNAHRVFPAFTKRRKLALGHFDKFSKKEENVLWSFWQTFKKRRKMSYSHFDKFSRKGGKCPLVILTNFQKRRKMSNSHSDKISKKEENVP